MGSVTKKWLFLKVSSAILIPLMIWFAMSLASIYDKSYNEVLTFISSQPSKLLFSMLNNNLDGCEDINVSTSL